MSFSSTPLGQGRRLDHQTFLGKKVNSTSSRSIPTSYAYGAPTVGTRSPPKAVSKDLDAHALNQRSSGPRIISAPLDPQRWSVKDTTVNVAGAFHIAAGIDPMASNPNASWASGSQQKSTVPRSTSVDYEKETQTTLTRRLAPPPSRSSQASQPRRPLAKQASVRHVPDSEGEDEPSVNGRARSPIGQAMDMAKGARDGAMSLFMKQRSSQANLNGNGHNQDGSYDYSQEERDFQETKSLSARSKASAAHKKNRMSVDNKAYKPSVSDDDDDDDEVSDGGRRKKKKGKKNHGVGGPLTTLPVAGYDKRRKKKGKSGKGGAQDDEGEDTGSGEEEQVSEQRSASHRPSAPRSMGIAGSLQNYMRQPSQSRPLDSLNDYDNTAADDSIDVERGLHSIPEIDEPPPIDDQVYLKRKKPAFSIGGVLGYFVNACYRVLAAIVALVFNIIGTITLAIGYLFGSLFDVLLKKPLDFVTGSHSGAIQSVFKYAFTGCILYAGWFLLSEPISQWMLQRRPYDYQAPGIPASDLAELSARLQRLETAFSGITSEGVRERSRLDNEARVREELTGRLGMLESRVQKESTRAGESEERARQWERQGLGEIKKEMQVLHAQIVAGSQKEPVSGSDDEARAKLKALEDRLGSVETGVKDALELGKNAVKVDEKTGAAEKWWNKLASGTGKSALTIKSSDGQDVTKLIGHLVDTAVARYSKDILAKADYALNSGGAKLVPHLTSETYEIRPQGVLGSAVGLVTGRGYAIGRPPVTAMHHELAIGHCWPFAGTQGQLGVQLSAPTFVSEVTIDHVAREVAFDMRSAPREMELWGLVEGRDNLARLAEWRAERAQRREEGEEVDEEPEAPATLPRRAEYVRVAKFAYDIHAQENIQTFAAEETYTEMGVDVGVVALRVLNNWGQDEFTCIYRLRVHGEPLGRPPYPTLEELA